MESSRPGAERYWIIDGTGFQGQHSVGLARSPWIRLSRTHTWSLAGREQYRSVFVLCCGSCSGGASEPLWAERLHHKDTNKRLIQPTTCLIRESGAAGQFYVPSGAFSIYGGSSL